MLALAADPALALFGLAMVSLSARYVARQELTKLPDVKWILLVVHAFFAAIFLLDLGRALSSAPDFMDGYTLGVASLAMWIAVLMTSLAYVAYARPSEATFGERFAALFRKRLVPHGVIIAAFTAYALGLDAFVVASRPYVLVPVVSWVGLPAVLPEFALSFIVLAAGLVAFFLATSAAQLVLAASRANNRAMRGTLAVLGTGWAVIAVTFFVARVYLVQAGLDAQGLGNLVIALVFGAFSAVFRRPSSLVGLFVPAEGRPARKPSTQVAGTPLGEGLLSGGNMLLEVDPSTNYEGAVLAFVLEQLYKGHLVFVFTTRGSPIWGSVQNVPEVRSFLLTDTPYPQQGSTPSEVLVPKNDPAVIYSVLDEVIASNPKTPKAMVFDSVSDLIMNLGFEEALKFLRREAELQSGTELASVFILLSNAHDERVTSLVTGVFDRHLRYGANGLSVVDS